MTELQLEIILKHLRIAGAYRKAVRSVLLDGNSSRKANQLFGVTHTYRQIQRINKIWALYEAIREAGNEL